MKLVNGIRFVTEYEVPLNPIMRVVELGYWESEFGKLIRDALTCPSTAGEENGGDVRTAYGEGKCNRLPK